MNYLDKNKKIGLIVGLVIVLVAVFYGGMVYGGNNVRAALTSRGTFGQNNVNGMTRGTRSGFGNMAGGFAGGEIISKDDKSITVKLQNGGSRIILLGDSTTVSKMTGGNVADLTIGTQVSITGTPNSDGSINAQNIQIRPATPTVVR